MKKILLVLAFLSVGAQANVTATQDTTSLTCKVARANVQRNGYEHYTINGQPRPPQYISYYYDDKQCGPDEYGVQAWAPTKDANHCPIGIVCVVKSRTNLFN